VRSFFEARSGAALLDASWVCATGAGLAGACLISLWEGAPLVAYIMTAAGHKGRGLAGALLERSLASLAAQGYQLARAFVTEGNTPSERLLARAGFTREP
jgi:RimJ/RimL family protein N-acetyltransferase